MTIRTTQQGEIITFYSYKGGTGRSMMLANVAWILASRGKRVLVADWDLEAPGVHRHFRPFLRDKELRSSEGIIDLVVDYTNQVLTPLEPEKDSPNDWFAEAADISRYALSLAWSFDNGGALDLVPAGRQDPEYSRRVNSFDWRNFYERLGGGALLESVRASMRTQYDYILVDSRTGVSDTAGISTVQMPDKLVVCFTLNNQSIEGAAAIANSVSQQRSAVPIFPMPMRVELSEKDKVSLRRNYARQRLGRFPAHLQGSARDEYWSAVETLYVPFYAYEEILATFADEPAEGHSVLRSAEQITDFLTGGEVQAVQAAERSVREWVREQFKQLPQDLSAAVARLAQLPNDSIPSPAPLPEGSRVPISRSPIFVGRSSELQMLARAISSTQRVAITGIAGVGKSQLAAEFAYQYGQFFAGGVFWLNFAEPSSIVSEVAACGNPGMAELNAQFSSMSLEDQVREVINAWRRDVPRLLIFDGCEDPQVFERWRPARGGCRVLLTSRRPLWDDSHVGALVAVGPLERSNSVALLRSRLKVTSVGDDELGEIAAILGDLPLALQVASGTLARATGPGQVAQLTDMLHNLDTPTWGASSPDTALDNLQASVTSAFALSVGRLDPDQASDRVALDMLARAACLATGVPIPIELLQRSLPTADDAAFEAGLSRLCEVGLLESNPTRFVSIHPVTAMAARTLLRDSGAQAAVDQALLGLARQLRQQHDLARTRQLEPHLTRSAERADRRADPVAVALWNELGSLVLARGAAADAQRVFETALTTARQLFTPEHVEMGATLNNLGTALQALGSYDNARAHLEAALAIYEKILGREDPTTLAVLVNLGGVAQRQGDYASALAYLDRALAVYDSRGDADDLAVANLRTTLGLVLASMGRLSEAEAHLRRALSVTESQNVVSAELGSTLNNLGLVSSSEGRLQEAELYFRRALEVALQLRGQAHPETARAQANLASVLAAQGNLDEAQHLLGRALATQEAVLGADHPDVAATLNNLARVQASRGHAAEAISSLRQAVAILDGGEGASNPRTELVRTNLLALERSVKDS